MYPARMARELPAHPERWVVSRGTYVMAAAICVAGAIFGGASEGQQSPLACF